MKYICKFEGETHAATSERKAKIWAREQLGCARLKQTPTETGVQYWDINDNDDMSDNCVTVRYA